MSPEVLDVVLKILPIVIAAIVLIIQLKKAPLELSKNRLELEKLSLEIAKLQSDIGVTDTAVSNESSSDIPPFILSPRQMFWVKLHCSVLIGINLSSLFQYAFHLKQVTGISVLWMLSLSLGPFALWSAMQNLQSSKNMYEIRKSLLRLAEIVLRHGEIIVRYSEIIQPKTVKITDTNENTHQEAR